MNFTSLSGKKWIFKKFDNIDVEKISEKYSLNEIAAKLIAIRKKNIKNIDMFLNPTIKNHLPNPMQLKDMDKAVERTYRAIKNNETIGVFGDYDVDGATSTALLARYFSLLKLATKTYIPDRKTEGYGPSIKGFDNLIKSGANLIFTVDCGTSSFEAINSAAIKKIDIIVLDHHQSNVSLPKAHAIVNPNRHDEKTNLGYLSAAGVSFVFLVALNKKLRDSNWFINMNLREPNILNFLDLVSLGTVCDVVPLVDLNRAIVTQGLKILKQRKNLGIKTLYDLCKTQAQPSTFDLGFVIGPRINAGGRVGKSSHAIELLTSNDPKRVYEIASDLDKYNEERKNIELLLFEEINSKIKNFHNYPVLVLSGTNWHEGIIGIVASRIKDKYNKPTILISINNKFGKGSARSLNGFNIGIQIIKATQLKILERGGGHKMAGGFVIKEENVDKFRNFLVQNFEKNNINPADLKNMYLDSMIAPSAVNENFFNEINCLGPFGSGNNEPKFMIENLKVIRSDIISNNHIRSILEGKDGSIIKSFAWNAVNGPLEKTLCERKNSKFNVAGKMKLNEWNGKKNIEFIIEDITIN